MDNKFIKRLLIFVVISISFTACSKPADKTESADQRFSQSMDWNEKHSYREIVVPSGDYSIMSMADSHVGSTNNMDSFFNIAKSNNTSAVVMVGDLTTGKSEDYSIFDQHLPDKDSLPLFFIIGNHDLHYNGWEEFYSWFGSSTYSFTIKSPDATDLYICLDTGGGTLGEKQLNWLKTLLQTKRKEYRHCMVFTHNNFFRSRHTDSTYPLVEELYVLLELFTNYHVDMVITGHDHMRDVVSLGTTTYIVMDALKDGLSNAGYFKITVKNGNIGYEFKNF
jgi:predicted phosphodiesterase